MGFERTANFSKDDPRFAKLVWNEAIRQALVASNLSSSSHAYRGIEALGVMLEGDATSIIPVKPFNPETDAIFTDTPNKTALAECEKANKLYVVLLEEDPLTAPDFCCKYDMPPSTYCFVYYYSGAISYEEAKSQILSILAESMSLPWDVQAGFAKSQTV